MALLNIENTKDVISIRYNFKVVILKEVIFFLLLSLFMVIMYYQIFEDSAFDEGEYYYLFFMLLLYCGYFGLTIRRLYKYRQVIIIKNENSLLVNDLPVYDYLFITIKHISGEYDEGYTVSIKTQTDDKVLFKRLPQEEATNIAVYLSDKLNVPVRNKTPESLIPFLGDNE